MNCPLENNKLELLMDYTAGKLNAPVRSELEQHMDHCASCASFRMEQSAVWDALDLWEPAPVSVDFNRRLWHRIDAVAATPWYRKIAGALRLADLRPLLPLTAAVALITAGFLYDHRPEEKPRPGMSVSEVNQVEQALDDLQLLRQFDQVSNDGSARTM